MIPFTITCFFALLLTLAALVAVLLSSPGEMRFVGLTCVAWFFALVFLAIAYGWGRAVSLWL